MIVSSWLIIAILSILLIVVSLRLLLFRWDIKRMAKQLEGIIGNFGTNELLRTNTHNKSLIELVKNINQLIQIFKQDQQATERRELELKQEITNISHDLRTPLTSIKGFTELLTDPTLEEEKRQEYVTIIKKKADNLIMIVDLFYELSQIDSSDKKLVMDRQSLDQIVVETMLMFYEDFEKKQLKVQIDEGVIAPILADKKATVRIVTNIIQNALNYAQNYFTISFIEDEKYVRLRAANDVESMDATELHRIFDRTYRLDTSRTGPQLGLGLHIVKQLIEKQGGKVTANLEGNEFAIEVLFSKWN